MMNDSFTYMPMREYPFVHIILGDDVKGFSAQIYNCFNI
ncbi:hypothetical protein FOPG_19862 [Fusarium oxysporum f. sp. conglutinans race 2 54008]|uniref:Uncharacterized protein n=1 Tax=Fusarium oxysporum f. sp. conglutinans race 2 54008 TaxID=1089457 RepID=X0HRQ9_FUSOX|nr:hypothetical protein FOPG_19974 [Fusarium oxysporum f. sp. conglutinans race 2 54008]EXL63864.1 hypothetical protein FOPG_19862 [Fusarium oxysporum f. sp. conglutinans race 2 54008]